MSRVEVRQLIAEYLAAAKLMHLATSVNGQPWVCSVWYAPDDQLNLYWLSSVTRRHSNEVAANVRVAGTVVIPHEPVEPPRGLQFQGVAEILLDPAEAALARSVYEERIFPADRIDAALAHPERPHRFYRVRPTQFVLCDEANFPDQPRQEYFPGA